MNRPTGRATVQLIVGRTNPLFKTCKCASKIAKGKEDRRKIVIERAPGEGEGGKLKNGKYSRNV